MLALLISPGREIDGARETLTPSVAAGAVGAFLFSARETRPARPAGTDAHVCSRLFTRENAGQDEIGVPANALINGAR